VQSFVRAELAARDAATPLKRWPKTSPCCARPASAINIDLIAGLPAQSEASWRESLDWVARLAPEHVSVYMLEVDEDSRLGREMLRGGARYGAGDAPGEDLTADLYSLAVERLAALGIPRYEISNFARPGRESLHNLKYWKLEPYAGFGAGAHSFDGRLRRENPEEIADYLAGLPRGRDTGPSRRGALLRGPAAGRGHPPRARGVAPLPRTHRPPRARRPARKR
jgi:oxygen-independent coproporphyrinogen III oxidase